MGDLVAKMKLVFAAAIFPSVLLAQERPLPVQRQVKLALTAALQDNFSHERYQSLNSHGCWCSSFDLDHASWTGGYHKVDDLDQVCADWFVARMCTLVTDS